MSECQIDISQWYPRLVSFSYYEWWAVVYKPFFYRIFTKICESKWSRYVDSQYLGYRKNLIVMEEISHCKPAVSNEKPMHKIPFQRKFKVLKHHHTFRSNYRPKNPQWIWWKKKKRHWSLLIQFFLSSLSKIQSLQTTKYLYAEKQNKLCIKHSNVKIQKSSILKSSPTQYIA